MPHLDNSKKTARTPRHECRIPSHQDPGIGEKITVVTGKLQVPEQPIVGYVEGDGSGPDITRACLRIRDAAVAKGYDGKRKIHWCETFLGEKAAGLYGGNYCPTKP